MKCEEICFLPAHELVRRIRARELSALEVMDAHLEQTERVNPAVNAICHAARRRAAARARGALAGALLALARGDGPGPRCTGLPRAAQGPARRPRASCTTFGSPIYRDHVPSADGRNHRRAAQARPARSSFGKTNTPEFRRRIADVQRRCSAPPAQPYDLTRTCGGSSGGAAVAVACGMTPLADGHGPRRIAAQPRRASATSSACRPSAGRVPTWPQASRPWTTLSVGRADRAHGVGTRR